ncbi:MAG TPA: 6,7-dimethyl-8-ribityllumazine synthase [Rhodospirillales bacterium]|jgi:6,7-dimethyl-8-ribityllumazine synthase|nr:MAG: 6,7-dimethyl-8-ribityllumazine synthase 1 [Alphaproteobacteria bacterium MarineAlpha3_Bin2]HIC30149.1 6,7-dimethyl-8-ribityllumazine synthase [Rhodospirillales bacterium]HIM26260.1 6,7-dimethyl-8-ribityllumazine synthase [Rhodospirillales bacterium]HIM77842.1 6,7-dimethyl-8-ribityllumazine synthase [Rhodospirillales bacterium]
MTEKLRVLIVEARFYSDLADEMAKGAIAALDKAGILHDRVAVPGTFEVPAAIRFALRAMETHSATSNYSGFIALGTVIRGETDHYDHICREVSRALMDIAVKQSVALGFGILTCETKEQAEARADISRGDKGADAAQACLRMMDLKKELRLAQR